MPERVINALQISLNYLVAANSQEQEKVQAELKH